MKNIVIFPFRVTIDARSQKRKFSSWRDLSQNQFSLGKTKEWHCRKLEEEMENRASIEKRSTRWIFLVAPLGAESVQIAQLLVFAVPK